MLCMRGKSIQLATIHGFKHSETAVLYMCRRKPGSKGHPPLSELE